ncbi:hypothetical protein ACET3Z_000858 [Daucus carota]
MTSHSDNTRSMMAPTKTVSDNLKRRCPLVRVKPCILKNTIDNLSVAQKQWVADTVSENDVHEILGLPKGDLSIDYISNYEKREAWKSQFSDLPRSWAITASDVRDAMKLSSVVDMNFKLNFLIIMSNVLIKGSTTPYLSLKMLGFSGDVVLQLFVLDRSLRTGHDKNIDPHPLKYWTKSMLESVDFTKIRIVEGNSEQVRLMETNVSDKNIQTGGELLNEQQSAIEVIDKVCKEILRDYGEVADVEEEIIYKHLKQTIEEFDKVQSQHFRMLSAASKKYRSDKIIELLKSRFENLNSDALSFVLSSTSSTDETNLAWRHDILAGKGLEIHKKILIGNKGYLWDWVHSNENEAGLVFMWNQVTCTKKDLSSLNYGNNVSPTVNLCKNSGEKYGDGQFFKFCDKLEQTMQTFNLSMSNINLVFFPICSFGHYYTVCYDISELSMVVLDNSNQDNLSSVLFVGEIETLHKRFTEFLRFKGYQKAIDIFWLEPTRLNLPWNTKYNTADSGIFLMRHMETYFGGENLFYAEKFVEESHLQQHQLNKLRFEYVCIILSTTINEVRDNVFKQIEEGREDSTGRV